MVLSPTDYISEQSEKLTRNICTAYSDWALLTDIANIVSKNVGAIPKYIPKKYHVRVRRILALRFLDMVLKKTSLTFSLDKRHDIIMRTLAAATRDSER